MDDDSVVILDGGDFAATASYVISPRRPLSFLDPGPFGTLGSGGGFALAAGLCRPSAEIWLLYGDGSAAFSLAEFDTFVRHGVPVVAVVENDGGWTQIARGQRDLLNDDVGTVLRRSDYHLVAEGYGGAGIRVRHPDELADAISRAKELAREGRPTLVNVWMGEIEFRKGSVASDETREPARSAGDKPGRLKNHFRSLTALGEAVNAKPTGERPSSQRG